MSAPSTREPQNHPVRQIIRGASERSYLAAAVPSAALPPEFGGQAGRRAGGMTGWLAPDRA
jgi:hypothetical protein